MEARKLIEQSVFEFTSHLAAKEPVPGGGGAAAVLGALAAALTAMSGRYSEGKKAAAGHEAELSHAIETADRMRMQLLAQVDADAEAFAPLATAWKNKADQAALAEATLNACLAPMSILQCCHTLLGALETMRLYGSKIMQSDVGCAASACAAAQECAGMNLLVNSRELEDGKIIEQQILDMLYVDLPRARKIAQDVLDDLRI